MNLTATIKFKGHVVSDVQPEKQLECSLTK